VYRRIAKEGLAVALTVGQKDDHHDLLAEVAVLRAENKKLLIESIKDQKIRAVLQGIDFDTLSPKKAFDLLWEWK
jgi:hypothetical protein